MTIDSLHDWLLRNNGDTAAQLWCDLSKLRLLNGPKAYQGLPVSEGELTAGLEELERRGLARSMGDGPRKQWWWQRVPEKVEPQGVLF